jgi:ribosomal protein S18 acetylase RimI-like enzyme
MADITVVEADIARDSTQAAAAASLLHDQNHQAAGDAAARALLPALQAWPSYRTAAGGGVLILLACDRRAGAGEYCGVALCFETFESCAARPSLWLHDLHVRASARRRGAGRALMEALVGRCGAGARFEELHLETSEDNAGARALYEACGLVTGPPVFPTTALALTCRLRTNTSAAAAAATQLFPRAGGCVVAEAELGRPADAAAVLAQLDSFQGFAPPAARADMVPLLQRWPDAPVRGGKSVLLARDDSGAAVGLALCLLLFTSADAAGCLYIYNLHVSAAVRGRGVGRLLLSAVFARAKAWGCTKLQLEVDEGNARARALYGSFGLDEFSGGLEASRGLAYTRLFYPYPPEWDDGWVSSDEEEAVPAPEPKSKL